MNAEPKLEKCLTFINCQLRPGSVRLMAPATAKQWRAYNFAAHGSQGDWPAEKLAECLQARGMDDARPWAVFDDLVEKVLEYHYLPARMANFMPDTGFRKLATCCRICAGCIRRPGRWWKKQRRRSEAWRSWEM